MSSRDEALNDLTLMLIYLTSWAEKPECARRAWKGYDFDVLNELTEKDMIFGSKAAKSIYLTEEGEKRANELLERYGISEE